MLRSCLCGILLGVLLGCSRSGPERVEAPQWDPDGFADAVTAKLDGNGDDSLDKSELAGAPGLAWGAKYIDADKNESLSRDELVARFKFYREMRLGLTFKQIQVSYQRRPLVGAKVQLVPEFFLDQVIEPASGEIGPDGVVTPQAQGVELPGMRVGYYRIVVESPRVKIPAKYGSADTTTAGVEVAPYTDDPAAAGTIHIELQ